MRTDEVDDRFDPLWEKIRVADHIVDTEYARHGICADGNQEP